MPGSCLGPALGVRLLETLPGGIRGVRGVSWAFGAKKSKFSRTAWEFRPQEAPIGSEIKNENKTCQEKGMEVAGERMAGNKAGNIGYISMVCVAF